MRPSLGLVGVGAFGTFLLRHILPFFRVTVCDPACDGDSLQRAYNVQVSTTLATIATCDIIVLATPVSALPAISSELAVFLGLEDAKTRPNPPIVMDVASVKVKPAEIMTASFPQHVDLIGLHPLFGPQSGKNGITGLGIAVCPLRGKALPKVTDFLTQTLGLKVMVTTPEDHDRDMAVAQGLTHMVAKIVHLMNLPEPKLTTTSFNLLHKAIEMVRHDSDALFRTISMDNPFMPEIKASFRESLLTVTENSTQ